MIIIEGIEFWGVRILGGDPGAQEEGVTGAREGGRGRFRGEGERFGFCLFGVSFVCVLFWGKFYSKM
jgi:hypothetical protein